MKNKSTLIFIAFLAAVAGLLGYNYFRQPFYKLFQSQEQETRLQPPKEPKQPSINFSGEEKISQLIAYPLTVDEQLLMEINSATSSANLSAAVQGGLSQDQVKQGGEIDSAQSWRQLAAFNPGIIVLYGENISTSSAQLVAEKTWHDFTDEKFEPLLAVDHEGGRVQRLSGEGFTKLPSWKEMCGQYQDQAEELFSDSARELNEVGINIVLAPVIDMAANSPVLGNRVCSNSQDTRRTAEFYIIAFSQFNIMPVIKHFPGIGSISRDLHDYSQTIELEPREHDVFRDLLDKYPNIGVMTAHIRVKNKLNNLPCSLSPECLSPFAEIYPMATLFTDSLDMESAQVTVEELKAAQKNSTASAQATASGQHSEDLFQPVNEGEKRTALSVRAEQALRAGNHFLLFGKGVTSQDLMKIRADLTGLYQSDSSFKSVVDDRFERVLQLKSVNY